MFNYLFDLFSTNDFVPRRNLKFNEDGLVDPVFNKLRKVILTLDDLPNYRVKEVIRGDYNQDITWKIYKGRKRVQKVSFILGDENIKVDKEYYGTDFALSLLKEYVRVCKKNG